MKAGGYLVYNYMKYLTKFGETGQKPGKCYMVQMGKCFRKPFVNLLKTGGNYCKNRIKGGAGPEQVI